MAIRKRFEYALYKGDKLLSIGTTKEIAEELGLKEGTIKHYQTPSYKRNANKRTPNKAGITVLIKLDDEDCEDII